MNCQILDSRLFIRQGLDKTFPINEAFGLDLNNAGHFANQMLLYDTLVVPTNDFGIVPVLLDWMGFDRIISALSIGSIKFFRRDSIVGYAGNGVGISGFTIKRGLGKQFTWWQSTLFDSVEDAIEAQVDNSCNELESTEKQRLIDGVLANTKSVQFDNPTFLKHIVSETHADIKDSPRLLRFVSEETGISEHDIDIARLPGIEKNAMQTKCKYPITDPVDLTLRVADINMEFLLNDLYGNCDLCTSRGVDSLLKTKMTRAGLGSVAIEQLIKFLEINNVPDLTQSITKGSIMVRDVWDLSQSSSALQFREFFRKNMTTEPLDVIKAYVDTLKSSSIYDKLPLTVLRLIVTTSLGAISLPVGIAAGLADTLVGRWLSRSAPRVFLDELSKLPD